MFYKNDFMEHVRIRITLQTKCETEIQQNVMLVRPTIKWLKVQLTKET